MTDTVVRQDIVVIGASLGGMEALKKLFAQLPSNLPAAVLVVWHVAPESPNLLPEILQRVTSFPISSAVDGETLQGGRAYIAPPDYHLVVEASSTRSSGNALENGVIRTTRGPRENRF